MALYFSINISRTAIDLLAIGVITAAGVYLVNELMNDETNTEVNSIEG